MNPVLLALAATAVCVLHCAESQALEWTLEEADRQWQPMTRAMQHVGVPGCQWQAGVFWNGSIIIGQVLHRVNYVHPRIADEVSLAGLGDNLLHLTVGYGDPMRVPERTGISDPDVRRGLLSGRLPMPWVEVRDGDVVWHETVFAHLLGRSPEEGMRPRPDDVLVVECSFTATNTGSARRTADLWLHFGDTSGAPAYSAQLPRLGAAIAHRFQAPFGEVDGGVRYVLPRPSSGEVTWHGALPAPRGMETPAERVIQWRVPLGPGEHAALRLAIPIGVVERRTAEAILRTDVGQARARTAEFWEKMLNGPGQILTPDPYINDYVAAVAGQMAQQVAYRHKANLWMYKTSPNWYEDYYPANAARAMPVFDLRGLGDLSLKVLQAFIDFQSDDASGMLVERSGGQVGALTGRGALGGEGFERHPGFLGNFGLPVSAVPLGDPRQGWTANMSLMCHGAMLWALAQHYRITRDDAWLGSGPGSRLQALLEAFDWIAFQRQRTKSEVDGRKVPHWGLLPPASAHDWLSGSTIFNDAWCILGMAETVRLLRETGHARAGECARELADYRRCLRDRYIEARDRARPVPLADGKSIPYVPRMVTEPDWAGVDWTYAGYGPLRAGGLGALDPLDELVTQALAFAEAGCPVNGDHARREHFWRHYVEPETHWPMYDLFLARDDLPRFFELYFNNLSAAVHRDFRVGCEARDGVVSCAPGDAERWSMTRAMFVRETGGYDGSAQALYLLQALPRCWLKPGSRMSVREMGTSFGGRISLDVVVSPDGETLRVSVRWSGFAVKPARMLLRLRGAEGTRLRLVEVNGVRAQASGGDVISLSPALSGKLEIVARFGVLP